MQTSPSPMHHKNLRPLLLAGTVVALVIIGAVVWKTYQNSSPVIPSTPPSATVTYAAERFSFSYPKTIFNLKNVPEGILLETPYFVAVDFTGEGKPINHPFQIGFDYRMMPAEEAMRNDFELFASTYRDIQDGKDVDPSFVETTQVDTKTTYIFSLGAEGVNVKTAYIIKSDTETLVVSLSYITDFLKEQLQPSPLSEKDQINAFTDVLQSIRFK